MRVETFDTPEPPKLRVSLASGSIRLETAETAETRVELEGPGEDDAKIELRGNDLIVEVERRKMFSKNGHRVVISAPNGAQVDVNTASADVEGRGRFAAVEANAASGDLSFEDVEGRVSVNTASGDVRVDSAGGDVRVNSASGDVTVGEARQDVRIRTASGDIDVRSSVEGKVEIQSASGDVEVGIRRGSKVWIDASSMSGDTTSELELSDVPTPSEGPTVELKIRTMSGDITVRRAS
jgi:DUF4097 and DUF4098 domain-containing protein YvlB